MKKEILDRLLTNGNIHTLKNEEEIVEAIGIKDGIIAFTGSNQDAKKKFIAKEIIDLDGKTVIPGMGDSHMHFYAYCQTLTNVNLGDCNSKKEVLEKLRNKAAVTREGEWIRGSNFDQSKWNDSADELPTRYDLDSVSIKHPIVIKRVCLHTAVANTIALEIANIDKNYIDGSGGVVEREADGTPNGILREQLTKVFDEIIPDPMKDSAVKKEIMVQQLRDMASYGITMMHTYAADIWKYIEDIEDYDALDKEGLLPLRVSVYLDVLEKLENKKPITSVQRLSPYHKTQLGGYKLFCDGSLGSRSAALYEPYSDEPDNRGILVESQESLEEKMLKASKMGIQCATHAIGDRALDIVITAIENTIISLKKEGWTDEQISAKPFRIIHAQLAPMALVERMKKLPVILDVQPIFYNTDKNWIEDRVGKERMMYGYTWNTYRKNGLLLTGGSDAPVEHYNPIPGIHSCVVREELEECMSVYDALCIFSKNIPYATGDEAYVGTLELGKFADLAILDRDIFSIPHDDILNTKVERTMIAGKDSWIRK
mgnify:FL=1